jgi:hypothetical protein
MYLIGMNGPPRAGKDTIAAILQRRFGGSQYQIPVRIASIVEPLARMGADLLGVEYSDSWYVENKSTRFPLFTRAHTFPVVNDTFREWMIRITEDFYKPRYGKLFWDRVLLNQLLAEGFDGILIITNIGFRYEAEFFQNQLGHDNCLFVQVSREGATYEGDSREEAFGRWNLGVHNLETRAIDAADLIYRFVTNRKIWQLR